MFFNRKNRIEKIIIDNLQPEFLVVENNSSRHHGHLGDDGTGETHFIVTIKSEKLNGRSKVEAHREINQLLKDEFNSGMHALEIRFLR